MKLLLWIIFLVLVGAGAFFAVSNRDAVQVDLWPFWQPVQAPLWFATYCAFAIGFLFGVLVAVWEGRRARARGRHEARRAERLARDNAALEAKLAQLQAAQSAQARPLPARSA